MWPGRFSSGGRSCRGWLIWLIGVLLTLQLPACTSQGQEPAAQTLRIGILPDETEKALRERYAPLLSFVAAETGLACEQAKAWQDAGAKPFRIAVNLSGRQLGQSNIIQDVEEAIAASGLDPSFLELELTESCVMKRAEQAAKILDALRELGTTIAIDDFGTGYSSLNYLKRLPVDRLKIDRSLIHDIPGDPNDVAIAKAIVAMGHSLGLSVIAEGIETKVQRDLLASIGCDEMQGFLFSPPIAASALANLLDASPRWACANDR